MTSNHAAHDTNDDANASPPTTRVDDEDSVFFALTAAGLLVAFDRHTGSVRRWMNCKLVTATALAVCGDAVLVMGDTMRVFGSAAWDVRGKLRPEGGDSGYADGVTETTRAHSHACSTAAAGAAGEATRACDDDAQHRTAPLPCFLFILLMRVMLLGMAITVRTTVKKGHHRRPPHPCHSPSPALRDSCR